MYQIKTSISSVVSFLTIPMVPVTLFLSFILLSLAYSEQPLVAVTIANQSSPHEARTIFLPVLYSTLGNQLASTSFVDLILVTHPSCHMPEVRGKLAVFVGGTVPMFTECSNAPQANIAIFARVVQSYGAYALLVDNIYKVCHFFSSHSTHLDILL